MVFARGRCGSIGRPVAFRLGGLEKPNVGRERHGLAAILVTDAVGYGPALVVCHAGKVNVNAEMVRSGWAVTYLGHERPRGGLGRPNADYRQERFSVRWIGGANAPDDALYLE